MKKLVLKFHSFVDVITNSSTVIYVQTHGNTIKYAKNLINELMSCLGINNKTADDFFEFEIVPDEHYEERFLETRYEEIVDEENLNIEYGSSEDKALEKRIKEEYQEMLENPELRPDSWGEDDEYGWDMQMLLIKPKDKTQNTVNLTNVISSIFEIDGTRDG